MVRKYGTWTAVSRAPSCMSCMKSVVTGIKASFDEVVRLSSRQGQIKDTLSQRKYSSKYIKLVFGPCGGNNLILILPQKKAYFAKLQCLQVKRVRSSETLVRRFRGQTRNMLS